MMADSVATVVRKEINRLKKESDLRESELASLKDDLRKHERVYAMLGGRARTARRTPARRRRAARPKRASGRARKGVMVNWNSVLAALPQRFTVAEIAKADGAKGKSPVYLRQIAVRWREQRKTRRVGRGKYQKVEQKKSRAKAS